MWIAYCLGWPDCLLGWLAIGLVVGWLGMASDCRSPLDVGVVASSTSSNTPTVERARAAWISICSSSYVLYSIYSSVFAECGRVYVDGRPERGGKQMSGLHIGMFYCGTERDLIDRQTDGQPPDKLIWFTICCARTNQQLLLHVAVCALCVLHHHPSHFHRTRNCLPIYLDNPVLSPGFP